MTILPVAPEGVRSVAVIEHEQGTNLTFNFSYSEFEGPTIKAIAEICFSKQKEDEDVLKSASSPSFLILLLTKSKVKICKEFFKRWVVNVFKTEEFIEEPVGVLVRGPSLANFLPYDG